MSNSNNQSVLLQEINLEFLNKHKLQIIQTAIQHLLEWDIYQPTSEEDHNTYLKMEILSRWVTNSFSEIIKSVGTGFTYYLSDGEDNVLWLSKTLTAHEVQSYSPLIILIGNETLFLWYY